MAVYFISKVGGINVYRVKIRGTMLAVARPSLPKVQFPYISGKAVVLPSSLSLDTSSGDEPVVPKTPFEQFKEVVLDDIKPIIDKLDKDRPVIVFTVGPSCSGKSLLLSAANPPMISHEIGLLGKRQVHNMDHNDKLHKDFKRWLEPTDEILSNELIISKLEKCEEDFSKSDECKNFLETVDYAAIKTRSHRDDFAADLKACKQSWNLAKAFESQKKGIIFDTRASNPEAICSHMEMARKAGYFVLILSVTLLCPVVCGIRWEFREHKKSEQGSGKGLKDFDRVYDENIKFNPSWELLKQCGDAFVLIDNTVSPEIIHHKERDDSDEFVTKKINKAAMELYDKKPEVFGEQ